MFGCKNTLLLVLYVKKFKLTLLIKNTFLHLWIFYQKFSTIDLSPFDCIKTFFSTILYLKMIIWIVYCFLSLQTADNLDITKLDFNKPLFGEIPCTKTTSKLPSTDYNNDESYKCSLPRHKVKQEDHVSDNSESNSNNSRCVHDMVDK